MLLQLGYLGPSFLPYCVIQEYFSAHFQIVVGEPSDATLKHV